MTCMENNKLKRFLAEYVKLCNKYSLYVSRNSIGKHLLCNHSKCYVIDEVTHTKNFLEQKINEQS